MKSGLYAVGKIPGGFIKREGRPSEKAILSSRLTDRPIRPLFPEGFRNEVQIANIVMSVDQDCSPEIAAMIGTSAALSYFRCSIQRSDRRRYRRPNRWSIHH